MNPHEGILTNDEFLAITAERERRIKYGGLNSFSGVIFRRKLICGYCGMVFCHTRNGRGNNVHHVWQCGGRDYRNGKRGICKAKAIPEDLLIEATMKVLGMDALDPELIEASIDEILVPKHHELVFILKDGRRVPCEWKNKPNGMKEKGLPDQSTLPDLPVAEIEPKPFSKLSERDKELIHKWRSQGYEYKRIAAALRRPVSTIRTFCIYAPREREKKALMERTSESEPG